MVCMGIVILVPILYCHPHFLTYTDPVPVPAHSGGNHPSATSPVRSGGNRPSATGSFSAHGGGNHPLCKLTGI